MKIRTLCAAVLGLALTFGAVGNAHALDDGACNKLDLSGDYEPFRAGNRAIDIIIRKGKEGIKSNMLTNGTITRISRHYIPVTWNENNFQLPQEVINERKIHYEVVEIDLNAPWYDEDFENLKFVFLGRSSYHEGDYIATNSDLGCIVYEPMSKITEKEILSRAVSPLFPFEVYPLQRVNLDDIDGIIIRP